MIKLIWAWIDPQNPNEGFTTQSPDELRPLLSSDDPLLNLTERRLTSCFQDEHGWYPNHPNELQ